MSDVITSTDKYTSVIVVVVVVYFVIQTTSTEAQCSDDDRPMNITSPGVTIRSPGFNGEDPYPANQTCEWLIQTGNEIVSKINAVIVVICI